MIDRLRHLTVKRAAPAAVIAALGAAAVTLGAATSSSTVAGTGTAGFSGDAGPATLAQLNQPSDLARLPNGDVLVADTANNRIRRIDADGTITTFAGGGATATPACGLARTALTLTAPEGVTVTPSGDVVVANTGGQRLVFFSGSTGQVTGFVNATFVGTTPSDVAAASDGSVLVADRAGRRVLRVQAPGCSGAATVTTVAGNGQAGATGDGGPATAAAIGLPQSVSPINATDFLVADSDNGQVRRVTGSTISTAAAGLATPTGVTSTSDGGFLVAEEGANRIRRVSATGVSTTAAGNGVGGTLAGPADALPSPGGFLVAQRTGNQVSRVLDATPDAATPAQRLPVSVPVLRRTAVVQRVRGTVLVRPRGKKKFVRLTDPALVRVGSEIDVERGLARVTVASDRKGTLAQASVRGGRFLLAQSAGSRPITTLTLSAKLSCPKPKHAAKPKGGRASISAKRRKSRRLWVQTHAKRYRTKGRFATGTVRGTRWLTTDGCRATRIAVTRGVVTVRDLVRKRNHSVRPGRHYTARRR